MPVDSTAGPAGAATPAAADDRSRAAAYRELPHERALREWMAGRGMRHERIVYVREPGQGATVAYRLAPDGPSRGVLLVAHGAGNDALFAFGGLFKRILLRGHEIFTFDLDGHGRASTTTLAYPRIRGAVGAALDQALGGREHLPVHVFGLSLGGAITLEALAGPLAGVASATLVSAPLRIEFSLGRVLNELRPVVLRTLFRERVHGGLWGMVPSFGPLKRGIYPLRLAVRPPGAFGYIDALNDVLDQLRLPEAAARIRTPVRLVYGSEDRIVPPEQGLLLERAIPDAELRIVPGGTHLSTVFDEAAVGWALQRLGGPDGAG